MIDGDIGKLINFYRPWCNTKEYYVFHIIPAIYFESGNEITNVKFKTENCLFENRGGCFRITNEKSAEELYREVTDYVDAEIEPWLDKFKNKSDSVNAVIEGKTELRFSTVQFMIDNNYGFRILPLLLDNYERFYSYILLSG